MLRWLVLTLLLTLTHMSSMGRTAAAKAAKKIALVTGATDGIGQLTSKLLAAHSYQVLVHGRSQERIENAGKLLRSEVPDADIILLKPYDLSSIEQSKELANHVVETIGTNGGLDLLVNNAGVFTGTDNRILTVDGLELTFQVNVVAPFVLFNMLMPLLRKTSQSRIINVSSISQGGRILDKEYFPSMSSECSSDGCFSTHGAYSHSKLCMAALNHELARRITAGDSLCLSCDPGTVNTKMLIAGWGRCGINVKDATTQFELSTMPFDPADHGKYFVGSRRESKCCADVYDDEIRLTLWNTLENLTGVTLY